ncbi:MAG: hypothetical protein LBC70_09895 [Chitinispirillales bacterium]|nr:hypothetical protein [Chitinispirillales bacterium]
MKKLFAAAVAACLLAVTPSMAAWSYDPVIDQGEGEATFGYYDGEFGIRIRYSPVENFEIFSSKGAANLYSRYVLGGRYQLVDELLTGALNLGIPVDNDVFGIMPAVLLKTGLTDMVSLSAKVGFGLNFGNPDFPLDDDMQMNLVAGIEFGFVFTDQMGLWAGGEFKWDDLTSDADLEVKEALGFNVGMWFSGGKIGVATMIGMDLVPSRVMGDNIRLWGGVEATVGF